MTTRIYKTKVVRSKNMKKSEFMLHAAMFDQSLLDKTCTVIVVTLLYGCQISVLSALSFDFIKYKLKRSNADSFHHHLAYLPNRKLYPNIRCRCGLDTVLCEVFCFLFCFVFSFFFLLFTFWEKICAPPLFVYELRHWTFLTLKCSVMNMV